jgi:acyl carrier protein
MTTERCLDRETLRDDVIEIVARIVAGGIWDIDNDYEITGQTRLRTDLGWESVDIVILLYEIGEKFQQNQLPFHELFPTTGVDVSIDQMADFLVQSLR